MSGVLVSLNGRTESAATIISSDVTNALGFAPYNSTNPSGYITSSEAPVQSVIGNTGAITAAQIASAIGTLVTRNQSVNAITSSTGVTLSAAQMIGGWIIRDGSPTGGITDSFDTAANLATAYNSNDLQVGSSFLMGIVNNFGQTLTVSVSSSTGVTFQGTDTINSNNSRVFLGVFTDVTAGSQAATITSLFSAGV